MHGLAFRLVFLIGLLGIVALLAQLARMVGGVPYPIFLGGINADVMRRVERDIDREEQRCRR
jgi:hypothetical protein